MELINDSFDTVTITEDAAEKTFIGTCKTCSTSYRVAIGTNLLTDRLESAIIGEINLYLLPHLLGRSPNCLPANS
jgi:hypothetical protein